MVFPVGIAAPRRDHFRRPGRLYLPAFVGIDVSAARGADGVDAAKRICEPGGARLDGRDGGASHRTQAVTPLARRRCSVRGSYDSRPVARILLRRVLGVMPSFSAARVLFQRESFRALSIRTRST